MVAPFEEAPTSRVFWRNSLQSVEYCASCSECNTGDLVTGSSKRLTVGNDQVLSEGSTVSVKSLLIPGGNEEAK